MSDLTTEIDRTVDDLYEAMKEHGASDTYQAGYLDALLDLAAATKGRIKARQIAAEAVREELAGKEVPDNVIPLHDLAPVTLEDIVHAVQEGLRRNRTNPLVRPPLSQRSLRRVIA